MLAAQSMRGMTKTVRIETCIELRSSEFTAQNVSVNMKSKTREPLTALEILQGLECPGEVYAWLTTSLVLSAPESFCAALLPP